MGERLAGRAAGGSSKCLSVVYSWHEPVPRLRAQYFLSKLKLGWKTAYLLMTAGDRLLIAEIASERRVRNGSTTFQ